MFFEIILTFGLVLLVLGMASGPKLNTRFIPLGAAAYIAAAATIVVRTRGFDEPGALDRTGDHDRPPGESLCHIVGPLLGGVLAVVVACCAALSRSGRDIRRAAIVRED